MTLDFSAQGGYVGYVSYTPWRSWFPQGFEDLRFLELIDSSGHWLQLEKPAETTAQMLRFLRAVEPC